ncbi:MAG: hypothetical protein AB1394_16815, partial [Bacteroidota bacterium]
NNTDAVSVQSENLTTEEMEIIKGQQVSASVQLTEEEMQSIKGRIIWKIIIVFFVIKIATKYGPRLIMAASKRLGTQNQNQNRTG